MVEQFTRNRATMYGTRWYDNVLHYCFFSTMTYVLHRAARKDN